MTTNLVLDARQRAMLAEMGVRVWSPNEVAQSLKPARAELAPADLERKPTLGHPQDERAASIAVPVRREPPLRLPVLSSPPAVGAAPVRYVIGNLPADAASFDIVLLGEACTGGAEKLLANMTRMLGDKVFVAQMVPTQNESESLVDQLTHLPAKVILALGQHAARALLGEASQAVPFGKLRGTAHRTEALDCKVVVTYHPLQLIRPGVQQAQTKAQTWLDLKLAMKEAK